MPVEFSHSADVCVASLSGEVDGRTAPALLKETTAAVKPGGNVIIDLSGVPYMSSAGLRMLLTLYRTVQAGRGKIVLVGLAADIREVMTHTGFIAFFTTFSTQEEALASLGGGA